MQMGHSSFNISMQGFDIGIAKAVANQGAFYTFK